jgi:hypothetical protein
VGLTDCMRRTRAVYHYAIRAVKRDQDRIINERIAVSILQNSSRSFWSEIKRIRASKSGTSRIVDGQADCVSIAQLFATKYRDLYTSVPYDTNEMQCIRITRLKDSSRRRRLSTNAYSLPKTRNTQHLVLLLTRTTAAMVLLAIT